MPHSKPRRRAARRNPLAYTLLIAIGLALILILVTSHHTSPASQENSTASSTAESTTQATESTGSTTAPVTETVTEPPATTEMVFASEAEAKIYAYAMANGLSMDDYPDFMVELLDTNPETETYVLEYPFAKDASYTIDLSDLAGCTEVPLLLQWDSRWGYIEYGSSLAGLTACGPTCLSMVAIYLTQNTSYTPAYMIQYALDNNYYVVGSGTSWSLFSQGTAALGMQAEELPLSKSVIISRLEAGQPVVCSMGPVLFTTKGHFFVLVGVEDGKFRVNDPNSPQRSAMLWDYDDIQDQIRNLWAISLSS